MSIPSSKLTRPPQLQRKARTGLSGPSSKTSIVRFDRVLLKRAQLDHLDGAIKGGERAGFERSEDSISAQTFRQLRLLVVSRQSSTNQKMIRYLAQHDMHAVLATTDREQLRRLDLSEPDLILIDMRLDQANSVDLLRVVRSASNIPVIVLGRHQPDEADRVIALELGADDCIAEPLGLRELVARIRAVLRRGGGRSLALSGGQRRRRYQFAGWQLDIITRRLTSPAGNSVALTKNEFTLLTAFLDAPLRPLTRETLLQATRVHCDVFDRSIDVGVLRLRRKLKMNAAALPLIRTERGLGYALAVPVEYL